ncbi:MAG TPA: sigma-54 dependent transcriptional regulator [Thermoanaerobaculia bacterium]|nr:sigma-54 dependent transcriptional regulator [Thermoanaerobaculia bacterium]
MSEPSAGSAGILVVDDEFSVRDSLEHWFRRDGYRAGSAKDAEEALERLDGERWDVVVIDMKMPGMDGLELQRRIRARDPEIVTILFTAFGSIESAVTALKEGAFDYVNKPIDPDELSHVVRRALDQRRLRSENVALKAKLEELSGVPRIVGESPEIRKVLELVAMVAPTEATVLIRGESGTGKELIAQALHSGSRRRYSPIVPVNCGALPDTLLESELFGHERGAFTGAQYRRKGRFEMADGGTLFLDEVGTLNPKTQVDLLRVLESKEVTRLGAGKPIKVDFRLICATNQDLEQLVADGTFREDLYYRINVVTVHLPSLRERREDLPLLARHFLEKYSLQMNRPFRDFSPEALDLLIRHTWPGNIRELANAVERALVVGKPPLVRPEDLPLGLAPGRCGTAAAGETLADVEKAHIRTILERAGWNISRAARILDIDRVTLYSKIRKFELANPVAEAVASAS